MSRLLVVVLLGACGHVVAPPERAADAPEPDAIVCSSPQLACGNECADPMTDHDHCGACDGACTDADDCLVGHCTDTTSSCFAIKQYNPAATDGPYMHKADGTQFYCDMTDMMEYDELDMLEYDVAHAGYTLASPTDLQNPILEAAFIWLYNYQQGLKVSTAFTSANCCFKADAAVTTNMLTLAAGIVVPALAGVQVCNPAGGYLTTNTYQLQLSVVEAAPLPANFFTTNPAGTTTNCAASVNPALFWKRHP